MQKETEILKRNYDKDPIVINDYGAYFQLSYLMLLFLIIIILWAGDFQDGVFETLDYGSFEFFRKVIVAIFMVWFIHFLYMFPKKFEENPSFFKFLNHKFQYIEPGYDIKNRGLTSLEVHS